MNSTVTYYDGITEVKIGDHVQTLFWWLIPTKGRVVYVPGISPQHPQMEHHGLRWVGLKTTGGDVIGLLVDPENCCLNKRDRFLGRDATPVDEIKPDVKLDG